MKVSTAVIPAIIERHLEDAAFLAQLRRRVCTAPDWSLRNLVDLDDRLEANLDGLRVAGEHGRIVAESKLSAGPDELFVSGVLAVESRDRGRMTQLVREGAKSPEALDAVISSFGRVAPVFLQGTIKDLLTSHASIGRQVGIATCVSHHVHPGAPLTKLLDDDDDSVRAWAIRACGEFGLTEHLERCSDPSGRGDGDVAWWSAWSSVLLGDRGRAMETLVRHGFESNPNRARAFPLALQAMNVKRAHALLQQIAEQPGQLAQLIRGSGIAGDPTYVPWLIRHMADTKTARVAGESFTLITGADFAALHLEAKRPEDFVAGPNDDPNDPDVDMDADDGLLWPDAAKIEKWWAANEGRFQKGVRYFMGAPVTREHCIDVLKNGYQRQRILAAHYLCLLEPGTPLFNTSAPAWRQQRLLAKMA